VLDSLAPALAGLGLGASLIIAIGAQNVFVLRQGLRREHVGAVVAVCALSDLVLIAAGVTGLGVLVERWPWAATAARLGGAAFLIVYAALAAYRAWRPKGEAPELQLREPGVTTGEPSVGGAPADEPLESGREPSTAARAATLATDAPAPRPTAPRPSASLRATVLTALALTWLNPHVYLDTVFLLGSVASGYPGASRWVFGAGAGLASILWFSALGFGSRLLARFFESPRAWRVLDGVVAVVMLAIAVSLLLG